MVHKRSYGESIIEALNKAQRIAFGPILFQAVRSGIATGFLKHIADDPCSEAEAAHACSLTPYATGVLTDVLVSGDVLAKAEDGTLSLTKTGQCLLFDEMTRVNFNFTADVCYRGMDHLTEALVEGRPAGLKELGDWPTIYPAISELPEPARTSWFAFDHYYSDRYFAMLAAELQQRLHPAVLFDVGGNTGKFAAACLNAMPQARVTLIDLPQQCKTARAALAASPDAERFCAAEVDWLVPESMPATNGKADVIWMSQFLDCFSPNEAVSILTRCKTLLSPNGRFAVLECLVDGQPFAAANFSLAAVSLYFTAMANGNSRFYRRADLEAIFKKAGLDIEYRRDGVGVSHTLYILKPALGDSQ